jgi:hypothetical protein
MSSMLKKLSRSSLKASCALDHSSLPNNVHYNHCGMFRLNLMGPNRLSYLLYFIPYSPLNFWVASAIGLCGLGC